MEELLVLKDQLISSFGELAEAVVHGAPLVVTGIVLFLLMLFVAKIVEKVLKFILGRIHFDALPEKLGFDDILKRMGLQQPLSRVLPRIFYYLLLVLFARAASDALGLTSVSDAIGSFLGYVPNLVSAVLILLLGGAAGQFAGKAIARAADGSGIEFGASLGSVVSSLILFVAAVMALGQLKIDTDIVRIVTICFLAGLALAFGLSFGLGTREVTRNIIAGFYARKIFRSGKEIEIGEIRGVLKAITPTQTLLEEDGRTVALSNSNFLEDVVKQ